MGGCRRAISALLALIFLSSCVGGNAVAAAPAAVYFRAEAADDGAFVDVTVSVANAAFNVFQFALRFDPAVVRPVDAQGRDTDDAADFLRVAPAADWLTPVGLGLDAAAGYLTFAAFVPPAQRGAGGIVDADGYAVCPADGVAVFCFRFRRVDDGDVALTLATDDGGPFNPALPEGAALLGAQGALAFALALPPYDQTIEVAPLRAAMTRDERLRGTLLLPLGGAFAAAEGVRVPLYPGEPGVTAFAQDGHLFVPLRFAAEALGAEVLWDNETQTVTVLAGSRKATLTVGADEFTCDGATHALDAPARFVRDPDAVYARTVAPLSFLAAALGVHAKYDSDTGFVIFSPADCPWDQAESAEQALMNDIALMLSPLMQHLWP